MPAKTKRGLYGAYVVRTRGLRYPREYEIRVQGPIGLQPEYNAKHEKTVIELIRKKAKKKFPDGDFSITELWAYNGA